MLRFKADRIAERLRAAEPLLLAVWTGIALIVAVTVIVLVAVSSSQAENVLRGVADLVKALAWPAAIVFAVSAFRAPITNLIPRVKRATVLGGSIEFSQVIEQQLEDVAAEAKDHSIEQLGAISTTDVARAQAISTAATVEDLPEIRRRLLDLASEYRRVRGAMQRGNNRDKAMSVIFAQMRALAQAAFSLRGEFAFSDDPGKRLAALAIAQVQPDPSMLEWVATRVGPSERKFVQYHAIQALLIAARNADASQSIVLDQAYHIARRGYENLSPAGRMERGDLLDELGNETARIQSGLKVV